MIYAIDSQTKACLDFLSPYGYIRRGAHGELFLRRIKDVDIYSGISRPEVTGISDLDQLEEIVLHLSNIVYKRCCKIDGSMT